MKQHAFTFLSAIAYGVGLVACAQVPGGSVVPSQAAREPMVLKAMPIRPPSPMPSPSPSPGHPQG